MHLAEVGALGWLFPLLLASFYSAAPLALAAMGGVLSERAGVVNIALEGFILTGAFVGVWAGQSSGVIGLLAALAVGALLGLLHAFLTQKLKMNHVVSGLGLNLLAAGATRYLSLVLFPSTGIVSQALPKPFYLALALLLPFVLQWALTRTKFGLRLRAVGENPESARMAGIRPEPARYAAVTLSGALAALAGACLLSDVPTFSRDMSAGKGFIALAAVIFGKWNPIGAALGALFFGFFYAVQTQFQISGVHLVWLGIEWSNSSLLLTLPYLMTIFALVSVVGRAVPPAALGQEEA